MTRAEVCEYFARVALVAMTSGCGGTVTGSTNIVDHQDAAAGGSGGSREDGASGGSNATGGVGGASGLVPCNDGTGAADCCPPEAAEGAACDVSVPRCSRGGCRAGFESYLYCGGGTWSAGKGLFPCGADAGLSGPAACVAAGGECVLGGSTCLNIGSQDCNPDRNPGGAFCCLDQGFLVACNDGSGKTDCCPAGAKSGGTCPEPGLTCSNRCNAAGIRNELFCEGTRWVESEALWTCDLKVDAGFDASVGIACGGSTCGPNQLCVHQLCGGGPIACMPVSDAGTCPTGWQHNTSCPVAPGGNGCDPPPCTDPPPYCADIPKACLPLGGPSMAFCPCADSVCQAGSCIAMSGRNIQCAAE